MGDRYIVEYDADYSAGVMTHNKLVEADSLFEVYDHPELRWGTAWGPESRRATPLPASMADLDDSAALTAFNEMDKSGEPITWTTYYEAKTLHEHPVLTELGLFRRILQRRAERRANY